MKQQYTIFEYYVNFLNNKGNQIGEGEGYMLVSLLPESEYGIIEEVLEEKEIYEHRIVTSGDIINGQEIYEYVYEHNRGRIDWCPLYDTDMIDEDKIYKEIWDYWEKFILDKQKS